MAKRNYTADRSDGSNSAQAVARNQLRSFVERIERLEEEKKTIADDIKDVYGEAKATGFDSKILKKVIQIRKQDKDERMEQQSILETYLAALGMLDVDDDDDPIEQYEKLAGTTVDDEEV